MSHSDAVWTEIPRDTERYEEEGKTSMEHVCKPTVCCSTTRQCMVRMRAHGTFLCIYYIIFDSEKTYRQYLVMYVCATFLQQAFKIITPDDVGTT